MSEQSNLIQSSYNPRTWYVPLHCEVQVVVLDDEVEAVVEPGPTPHVLRAPARQRPAKTESFYVYGDTSDIVAI